MKVYYHSALNDKELISGDVFRAVPCKAYLELKKDKTESPYELIYNWAQIDSDAKEVNCNEKAELVVKQNGEKYVYSVRPLVQPLSAKYAGAYEQFSYEYGSVNTDEISAIQGGALKLYAIDQSTEVHDYTEVFEQIKDAFKVFKIICEKPKSYLKAINEVRPIDTVKRIGYESIPYLAAHSEDWLARTASGLKPARLFSRVEEDEYQIYENRVVKTLIDLIIGFLRKTEKQLRDQRDQLNGIMNSSVQTESFGFDVKFQIAVSELMSSDERGEDYISTSLALLKELQEKADKLLKQYRTLRKSRLYRYLRKSKPISNPLNETNILTMDKHYSVIFKLWKTIHHVIMPKVVEEETQIAFADICNDYQRFCATLCGYAAHVLGFNCVEKNHYNRKADYIDLKVKSMDDGRVCVSLQDTEPRKLVVPPNVDVPIAAGMCEYRISYDGYSLIWPNDIRTDEINDFCSLFKTKASRGKEQNEERRKYAKIKKLMEEAELPYKKSRISEFVIIPIVVELAAENRVSFKAAIEKVAQKYNNPDMEIIVAMPICNETEQEMIEYAKEEGQNISLLPLTMFDINSFRRLQNVLYRQILKLGKDSCPNCGGKLREQGNQRICDNCKKLTLTKTRCPNPDCRHEYVYMSYDVSEKTLEKMQKVQKNSFFEWDSLYQYKDVVNMTVASGKIKAICPYCHQS